MKRPTSVLTGVCLALLVLSGACRPPSEAPAKPQTTSAPIRIAFNTWFGYSSFHIAEEKGFFAKRGLTVDYKVIDPLAEKNAALLRGDLDGMGGTIDSAVVSAASGVKGRVVFMFDRSNGTDGILVTEPVSTISDLRGAKVALEEGFVGHFFLLYLLDKEGISPDEVEIVPMTTDQAGAAFVAGSVDAAVTWEPYLSTAAKRPGAKVLANSSEVEPILADTLFLSESFLLTRPGDVNKLVAALQEANDWWIRHPDDANAIVSRNWDTPEPEVAEIMQTVELYSTELQRKQFGMSTGSGDLDGYLAKAADLWFKAGVVEMRVDPRTLIDGSAVRALAK